MQTWENKDGELEVRRGDKHFVMTEWETVPPEEVERDGYYIATNGDPTQGAVKYVPFVDDRHIEVARLSSNGDVQNEGSGVKIYRKFELGDIQNVRFYKLQEVVTDD